MNSLHLTVVLLSVCCVRVHMHLCLVHPHQRGSMGGLNKPGVPDCFLRTSPCGGRTSRAYPSLAFKTGSLVEVTFQKNLDHFYAKDPGYFSLSTGNSYATLQEVTRVADKGEPSLSLYHANITVPNTPDPFNILQVRYVTNNPAAPPVFYQCADYSIVNTEGMLQPSVQNP